MGGFITLSIFISGVVVFYIIVQLIDYGCHKGHYNSHSYGYAKFEDFLKEFYNSPMFINGYQEKTYSNPLLLKLPPIKGVLVDYDTDSRISMAGFPTVKFKGIDMVMSNIFEYWSMKRYLKQHFRHLNKENKKIPWKATYKE